MRRSIASAHPTRFLLRRRKRFLIEPLESRLLLASAAYSWQNANIGAGGYVDGIFFSPTQQNVIYARTDIGGLYKTTNDGANWQQLLDWVPSSDWQKMGALSFAIDPQNPNNIYVDSGLYSGSNGWVLRSSDAGATFTSTNLPFYVGGNSDGRGTGERLALDPNLGSVLFLGSNDHGLYQSSNSAASFVANSSFNTLVGSSSGVTFVSFDPRSGTPGHASQTIYVGVNSTAAGTNLYKTTNGGASWTELTGGPTGLIPMQAALDTDGNIYFTFSNALPPAGSITTGALWRYNSTTSAWATISPVIPGVTNGSSDTFGYAGVVVDPQHAGTVVITSFDRYNKIDTIWRTTNATATTLTWVALYDHSSSQNFGYGGYNTTRNTANAPWAAANGDGIGNWASAIAINPFNSAQIMYGTGEGIWATNNGTSNAPLTAPNSWYFPDTGIEFTSVLSLAAPASGVPLYSAMGDIGGFSHTTLNQSPAAGANNGGTDNVIDFAQANPSFAAILGNFTNAGGYSTDSGRNWTAFGASPGAGGTLAVSASGATLLRSPTGALPFYSTNNGATWTASTLPAGAPTGGHVISDRVNPSQLYYWTSSGNQWTLYVSSDGGASFSQASQLNLSNCFLVASPFTAGDLWLACSNGIYHSSNFGGSFSHVAASVQVAYKLALGHPAPGQSNPEIYLSGRISNLDAFYRSDDSGATWVQINDTSHQWGGTSQTMAADPSNFGRVYMGFNGRGIIMGTPASALPGGWTDQDINAVGNPGFATSSTVLSSGVAVNQWMIEGGGAGMGSTTDQFNFAYQTVTGNFGLTAQIKALNNNGTGTPQAGLMFRSSTNSNDPFAAVVQTTAGQLIFEWRTVIGGAVASTSLAGVPVGAEYLQLLRVGNNFTASYGTDGTHWTQLSSPVAIAAMPATANLGLAVTAGYNPQLSSATLAAVTAAALPAVLGRYIYYNHSYWNDSSAGRTDDTAIDSSKSALLPGQTATFANYTGYLRGINGIMVDLANVPATATLSATDFNFTVGNNSSPGTWAAPTASPTITLRRGKGVDGSDRVEFTWADNAIQNQWVQVTLNADANTGLSTPDVFYFGNAIGETGNSPTETFVDASDMVAIRDNITPFGSHEPVYSRFDLNRDGFADASDMIVVRDHINDPFSRLQLITPGASGESVVAAAGSALARQASSPKAPTTPAPSSALPEAIPTSDFPFFSPIAHARRRRRPGTNDLSRSILL